MKRNSLITLLIAFALVAFSMNAFAADAADEDTDTRIVDAEVVEVTESRISVIARSGVEHVIAINRGDTKVKIEGKEISLKDVREGDVVTVELDTTSPMKLAKNIRLAAGNSQVARARR